MKHFLIFFAFCAAAAGLAGVWYFYSGKAKNGDLYSILSSRPTVNGSQVELPEKAGQIFIVNFWATWCGPCIQETPSLFGLAADRSNIRLVSISEDDSVKDVRKFLTLYPNSSSPRVFVVHDLNRELARTFGVGSYPESFIFNSRFELVRKINGAVNWDSPDIQALLNSAANEN